MTAVLVGPCCCKCCATLRVRFKLVHRPGYGPFILMVEIADFELYNQSGTLVASGSEQGVPQASGKRWDFGNLAIYNSTDVVVFTLQWTQPGALTIDISADASKVEWNDSTTRICEDSWVTYFLKGGPLVFSDTCDIIPSPYDPSVDSYAYTDWHEVELCTE